MGEPLLCKLGRHKWVAVNDGQTISLHCERCGKLSEALLQIMKRSDD